MNAHEHDEKTEPSFFKWIRAVRAEIGRDTEGMTPEEHVAYIHAKAGESRRERAAHRMQKEASNHKRRAKSKNRTSEAAVEV